MTAQHSESVPPNPDLTPEEEAWCEDFFRNLFPEDEEPSGSSDA